MVALIPPVKIITSEELNSWLKDLASGFVAWENDQAISKLLESLALLEKLLKTIQIPTERESFLYNYRQIIIQHLVKILKTHKPEVSNHCRLTELGKLQALIDDCLISVNDHSSDKYWIKRINKKVDLLICLDLEDEGEDESPQLKVATISEAEFDGDDCGVHSTLKPLKPLCEKSFTGQMFIKQSKESAAPFESFVEAVIAQVGDRSKCHFLLFNDNRTVFNKLLWVSIDGEHQQYHNDLFSLVLRKLPEPDFEMRTFIYEPHVSPVMFKNSLPFPFNDVQVQNPQTPQTPQNPVEFFIHGDSSADWCKLCESLESTVGKSSKYKTLMFKSRKNGWMPGKTMFVSIENLNYDLTIEKLFNTININDDFMIPENYTVEMIENIYPETIILESQLLIDPNYVKLAREFLSNTKDIKFVLFHSPYESAAAFLLAVTIKGMNKSQAIEIFQSLPSSSLEFKLANDISESQIQTNKVPFVYDSDYNVDYYRIQKFYHCNVAKSFGQLKKLKQDFRGCGHYEFFGPFHDIKSQSNPYPYFILKTTSNFTDLYQELVVGQNVATVVKLDKNDITKLNKLYFPLENKIK